MTELEYLIGAMSVAELARFTNTTVEQVVAAALGKGGSSVGNGIRRIAPSTAKASRPPEGPRGALRLDHVLTILGSLGGPAKLDDVRGKVGGSAAQVRGALQKLAKAGKVKITGERRGTRYVAR